MHGQSFTHILSLFIVLCFCTKFSFASLSSGAIFPLYIYPGDGCTAWSTVTSTIPIDGDLIKFYIVVNPGNGPGGSPGSQPDTNYQSCIASLRSVGARNNNLVILGYVATGRGTRDSSIVTSDIDTYSQWASAYRPDGIFFDEVSTSIEALTTYQSFTDRVHQDFGTSFIVLNPGAPPLTSGYFNIANLVVTFEGNYNDYSPSLLTIAPDSPSHKQVVILHDGPAQLPLQIVDEISEITNVGASFITNFPNAVAYENIPSYWSQFISFLVGSQTA